jgi:hypothetical protein
MRAFRSVRDIDGTVVFVDLPEGNILKAEPAGAVVIRKLWEDRYGTEADA